MIKPETLLKCARKAHPPNYEWWIADGDIRGRGFWNDDQELGFATSFDIKRQADQMALQIALEKEGICFYFIDGEFIAMRGFGVDFERKEAKTKPELLARIVEESP